MAPASILLVTCVLVIALTECSELVIDSTYPKKDNFSFIELVCTYDSELPMSGVIGARFQWNGTDVEKEIDSVETVTDANSTVHFLLTKNERH